MADFRKYFYALMIVAVLAVLTIPAQAQLPTHFTGAGLGFQQNSTPRTSGWFNTCTTTVTNVYGCAATDYAGGTTSARIDVFPLIAHYKSLYFFGRGGAGAATGANGGVGGSFDAGGAMALALPQKLVRAQNMYAVFSGSWQKNNVLSQPDIGSALKAFGQQTVWRFGVGKGW